MDSSGSWVLHTLDGDFDITALPCITVPREPSPAELMAAIQAVEAKVDALAARLARADAAGAS